MNRWTVLGTGVGSLFVLGIIGTMIGGGEKQIQETPVVEQLAEETAAIGGPEVEYIVEELPDELVEVDAADVAGVNEIFAPQSGSAAAGQGPTPLLTPAPTPVATPTATATPTPTITPEATPEPTPEPQQAVSGDCSSDSYNCSHFSTQAAAQALFDKCGGVSNDIHGLDRNKDGVPCESLP